MLDVAFVLQATVSQHDSDVAPLAGVFCPSSDRFAGPIKEAGMY